MNETDPDLALLLRSTIEAARGVTGCALDHATGDATIFIQTPRAEVTILVELRGSRLAPLPEDTDVYDYIGKVIQQ